MTLEFPSHHALSIHHNEHRLAYQKIREWADPMGDLTPEEIEWLGECEAADSCWCIRWYPSTPIGSCVVYAPTFELAMARFKESAGEDGRA